MATDLDTISTWLVALFGMISGVVGWSFSYVLKQIENLRREVRDIQHEQEELMGKMESEIDADNKDLWNAIDNTKNSVGMQIDRLRQGLDDDRKAAANDRAQIAAQMVTRGELDRQLDQQYQRLVAALGRKNGGIAD